VGKFYRLVAILGVALCGCNPQDAAELKQDAGKLVKTTTVAAGNAKTAGNVALVLGSWKGLRFDGLRVEAKDDVVTLNGSIRTAKEKAEAGRVANQIHGVNKVINNLKVEEKK
jgi:hypothetical protein